jgi:murein DD-endopeptidase MepM/ murein hydrolase activator NlpD
MSTMPTGGGKVSFDSNGIAWVVPCSYRRVSSSFGDRTHPVYGVPRFHSGVDLATPCPNKIYASRAGVVTISKYSSSAGYYVTIDHLDGYYSSYMHMCKMPDVKVGDIVTAGQVIGCIGTTGTSTGNHLHFEIFTFKANGEREYLNPMNYIGN